MTSNINESSFIVSTIKRLNVVVLLIILFIGVYIVSSFTVPYGCTRYTVENVSITLPDTEGFVVEEIEDELADEVCSITFGDDKVYIKYYNEKNAETAIFNTLNSVGSIYTGVDLRTFNKDWLAVQFGNVPESEAVIYMLKTLTDGVYIVEGNAKTLNLYEFASKIKVKATLKSNYDALLEIVDRWETEYNNKKSSLNITKTSSANTIEDIGSPIVLDTVYGVSPYQRLVLHTKNKVDPVKTVEVYSDISCNKESTVFSWAYAYENDLNGLDIVLEPLPNVLVSQDRLDYNIDDVSWGKMNRLYVKVKLQYKEVIVPIEFDNGVETPTAYTVDSSNITWFNVENASEYRVYYSEMERDDLARKYSYIEEKPKYLCSVIGNNYKIPNELVGKRFYITSVVNGQESLFSEEVSARNKKNKYIVESSEAVDLENNIIEFNSNRQLKYAKASVDLRTNIELYRANHGGLYDKASETEIETYVVSSSFPSNINNEPIDIANGIELADTDEDLNKALKKSNVPVVMNNLDSDIKKYINGQLENLSLCEGLLLNSKSIPINTSDAMMVNQMLHDIISVNSILNNVKTVSLSDRTLNVEYKIENAYDILIEYIEFSKELWRLQSDAGLDKQSLVEWQLKIGWNSSYNKFVNMLRSFGCNSNEISTTALDIMFKANGFESLVFIGEKSGEPYKWLTVHEDDNWYQIDTLSDGTSKSEYRHYNYPELNEFDDVWYYDKHLVANNEDELISIVVERYNEKGNLAIKLGNGYNFNYTDSFGVKLAERLQSEGYSVDNKFSYSVAGSYIIILK